MPSFGQWSSTMASQSSDAALQVVFGKAFLVELQRGDLETAKLFARAFLLRTPSVSKRALTLSEVA